ncbi:hypothetical protein DICVIV_04067 [Dictyocaulus viviparus]|uniref:Heme transporter hrg-1 n=1 Tax=Dictyocaulus viviparus TaxID=29172 RepID=A0A0D8Y1A1_DICVI|nr:hypothetical protein DICVIV_04067 [Dictyocaulus viviparus]
MCNTKVRIAIAILGISAGLMAGCCFAVQYQNWPATTMAFLSAVAASVVLYVHLAYSNGWIHDWSRAQFKYFIWGGWTFFVVGMIGMICSLINAGVKHQTLTANGLKGGNFWITAVWFFMLAKWTSLIAIYTRQYMDIITIPLSKSPPIPVEQTI